MPFEDEGSAKFKIHSRTTYRNKLWQSLEWLDLSMNEIIFVHLQAKKRLLYYSGCNKDNAYSKYNLKYTIGVQISTGRICLINGPDPSSVHDIMVWHGCKGVILIHCYDPFEIVQIRDIKNLMVV
jgi:hypothetical protein